VFGLQPLELLVLGLIAFMFFGERLPDLARDAARLLKQARAMADGATKGLREELGPEFADLDVRDLHPRTLVQKHIVDAVMAEEDEAAVTQTRAPVSRPPTTTAVVGAPTRGGADATRAPPAPPRREHAREAGSEA
jgi:sec-independent protein translocase protein TatB